MRPGAPTLPLAKTLRAVSRVSGVLSYVAALAIFAAGFVQALANNSYSSVPGILDIPFAQEAVSVTIGTLEAVAWSLGVGLQFAFLWFFAGYFARVMEEVERRDKAAQEDAPDYPQGHMPPGI